jgi:hypothetical protein
MPSGFHVLLIMPGNINVTKSLRVIYTNNENLFPPTKLFGVQAVDMASYMDVLISCIK